MSKHIMILNGWLIETDMGQAKTEKNGIVIYTDGYKQEEKVEAAYVALHF